MITDLVFSIFLEILALLIILVSNGFQTMEYDNIARNSQYYPKLIGYILMIVGLLLLIITITKLIKEHKPLSASLHINLREFFMEGQGFHLMTFSIILILFALGLTLLGFIITSIAFLFLTMLILSKHIQIKYKIYKIGALAVGLSLLLFIVFVYGANLPLPKGVIFK